MTVKNLMTKRLLEEVNRLANGREQRMSLAVIPRLKAELFTFI